MSARLLRPGDAATVASIAWRTAGSGPKLAVFAAEDQAECAAAGRQQMQRLGAVILDLGAQSSRVRAECEEDAVRLAIAIAHRVLHRELAIDADAILGLVKEAFARLNGRDISRLRMSPTDAATVEEHRLYLALPPGLELISDGSLAPGSAIFETSRGDLDASIDTQLAEIERSLT